MTTGYLQTLMNIKRFNDEQLVNVKEKIEEEYNRRMKSVTNNNNSGV